MAEQKDLKGGLKARIERRDGATKVALSGTLNELTDLSPLQSLPSPIHIDLEHVDRINSLGVRNWMNFIRDAEAANVALVFERCSPTIVSQMSMISNFMGTRSRVTSVIAVYLCPSCMTEHLQGADVVYGKPLQLPASMPCRSCGSAMEVDDLSTYANLFERLGAPAR